jgi:hypothetical protein
MPTLTNGDASHGVTYSTNPQQLREQHLSLPVSADDMPTVTVRASFDWKFWFLLAGAAWVLWESFEHMTQGEHRKG